jgi:hypothetical protein
MRLEFHPEAELELYEAASFYDASLSGLGSDFGDEVVYSAEGQLIYIIALAHGSREPGYWKTRVPNR